MNKAEQRKEKFIIILVAFAYGWFAGILHQHIATQKTEWVEYQKESVCAYQGNEL